MRRETRYARSGDVNIAYQIIGEGPFDLVFVMGWVSHLDYFWEGPSSRFLERLRSFSRLILFDKRGTGLSDRVATMPAMDERMDDVRAVMDAAGSERAVLLGISEGAAMCALFAATFPDRTKALVMYGAYAKRQWAPDYPWAPTPEQRQEFFDAIEQGWGGVVDLATLAPSTIGDTAFQQWWATYLQRSASPGGALALARMNTDIDIRNILPAIHVPTLILHRTGDLDIDVGGARYMASVIPNATYVELPGDDHLVFAGDQDAVLAEIELFLTGQRPAPLADRVLTTLMMTEIVGAAGMALRLGDEEWARVLAAHDDLVAREVARARGRLLRRTVNGILVAFDGPARALSCAGSIVKEARSLGLVLRAGVHTGECERVGNELTGLAVQIVARVLSRAGPGKVVTTSTVKDLVAGSGIAFELIDVHVLVEADNAWRLYRVDDEAGELTSGDAPAREGMDRLIPRECQVASLVAEGLTNREIGERLVISVATAERHVANIMNKLDCHTRSQIAVWAVEHGLAGGADLA
jgi:pimeloyl-ACP methyl ester carboxylesterase/DNA-binding CsgD family transcriptional regulator